MTFVSSPLLSDLWCHLNLEAHTQSVCSMSHADRVTSYVTLRDCVFVCGCGHWRWMHESLYLLYVFFGAGVNLNFQMGWMLLYNLPALHCNFSFYAKKGYLSIKEIHPSYSDLFNSLCIRCCCFKSHNSSSQGEENSPKGYQDCREI